MKKILSKRVLSIIITLVMVCAAGSIAIPAKAAYSPVADYTFDGTLADSNGTGDTLINLNPATNVFATESVNGTSQQVLTFGTTGGLQLQNVNNLLSSNGTYTIEIIARLNATPSYSKILDFKNLTVDTGLYLHNDNKVVIFPNLGGTLINNTDYFKIGITRDGTTNTTAVYINGVKQMTINDSVGDGIISAENILNFFTDDTGVIDNNAGGAVSRIRIYNRAFSESDMQELAGFFGSSDYMKYNAKLDNSAYNIYGCVDGTNWLQTTCYDAGFGTFVKTSTSALTGLSDMQNGIEKLLPSLNLGVTQNLSFVRDGKYVKVEYVIRNTSSAEQTVSLGSGSDIQIGSQDNAPITAYADGSGFYMSGNDAQFIFIGRNSADVTDVDTFWFGLSTNYYNHSALFTQTTDTSYNSDSAMCYSWKDRVIPAGGSLTVSVLFGVRTPNALPTLEVTAPTSSFADSYAGDTVSFSGSVADAENSTGTEIYYQIDSLTPVKAYSFSGVPGVFTADVQLPNDLSVGDHTIVIYAQDSDGGISESVTRTIRILPKSSACDITAITSPSGARIGTATITSDVPYSTERITVAATASANATWALYSDSGCTNELAGKVMSLSVGVNTAYLKVTAQDGTVKIYTLTVTRADGGNPSTGDTTPLALYLAMLGAGLLAAPIIIVKKRKNEK